MILEEKAFLARVMSTTNAEGFLAFEIQNLDLQFQRQTKCVRSRLLNSQTQPAVALRLVTDAAKEWPLTGQSVKNINIKFF